MKYLRFLFLILSLVLACLFFAGANLNPAEYSFGILSPVWDAVGALVLFSAFIFWPKIEELIK